LTVLYSARLFKLVRIRFNSILPLNTLSESDPLLRKGILTLIIPSFTRGAVLRSFINVVPAAFLYTQTLKLVILARMNLMIITFILSRYVIWFKCSLFLFPMWRLALMSARLFIPFQKKVAWGVNAFTFRLPLTGLSNLTSLNRITSYLFRRSYIFRWIASIPLVILIFYQT
jgi:hypothetical protein